MSRQDAEAAYEDEVIGETTLPELFAASVERNRGSVAQRYKGEVYERSLADRAVPAAPEGEYASLSYEEMGAVVRALAVGFRELGVEPDDRVGLFADTRMEWAQCDFALLGAGAVVTTVYTSSSPEQVEYLLDDPGATGVVVENGTLLERVLEVEDALDLAFVVVLDEFEGYDDRDDVLTLADVHERGVAASAADADDTEVDADGGWIAERDLDDLASLVYTSGTTGQPKGVELTHGNFRANVNQVRKRFGPRPDKGDVPSITAADETLSFLPLAHVFERLAGHFVIFASGATVAYAESPDTLQEDFPLVGPTTGTSVPRVYEKLYDSIREQAAESPVQERIFEWAVGVGREHYHTDDPGLALRARHALADRLVFEQVREGLGGNVDFFFSGGGSLSPELCALYHAMGLPILEGYGLTETAPVVSTNPPEEPKVGTIGPPLSGVETRVDGSVVAPDVRPQAGGEVGELLVRGPNVTDGYWNKPEATAEAFEGEWFRTGDVVENRPDGYLQFRERSKQLLVLSTGKNVAPGPIEDAFAEGRLVEQCMAIGDGEKFVGAVIVPNVAGVRDWAAEAGVDLPEGAEEICEDERVQDRIAAEVERINEGFESYERIKKFVLAPEEFTEGNDLLTPTMKKKRRNIIDRYEGEIERLYAE